jgi:thiazole synthase
MWTLDNRSITSRLWLGTARYPSPAIMQQAIIAANTNLITVSLRRQSAATNKQQVFWEYIKQMNCQILPNTAGCRSAKEAIQTAVLARELFATSWIKVEVMGDDYNLQPDPFALVEACQELLAQGFFVFPYCTDDLVLCQRLLDCGCQLLMPWGSPIGSGQGLANPLALKTLRTRFPNIPLVIDAGIGTPADAVAAMLLGFDAVLLNSAVALAQDPPTMAKAFALAVEAGHLAYKAGCMPKREFAQASTPLVDVPFWQQEHSS